MNMRAPSSSFSPVGVPAPRGQFSEYLFARSSKGLPLLPNEPRGQQAVKSYPNIAEISRPNTDDPAQLWAHTLRQIPLKQITHLGEVSPETVVSWRKGRTSPTYVKAMLLGRRVGLIRSAILETLGVEMPEKNRVIARLLCCLADIAAGQDQVSAARARLALSEFAEAEP